MTNPPRPAKIELPLKEDSEIESLVHDFESLTLPYENWTHRAHLAAAVNYVRNLSYDDGLTQIRSRINAYNVACGDPNGYNETITVMFIRRIASESKRKHCDVSMHNELTRLEVSCGVDWLYKYHSRDSIWSPEAKKSWVAPDKTPLDF